MRKGQIETPADNILGVGVYSKKERGHVTAWKLADFGIAKMLTREAQEAYYGGDAPGIPTYMGPEVLKDFETYSASSDVWSMGLVIAFYMRNGRHVFNCNDDVLYYEPGMASDMIFTDECYNNYSPELIRLVSNMIQVSITFALLCMLIFTTLYCRHSPITDQRRNVSRRCAPLRGADMLAPGVFELCYHGNYTFTKIKTFTK